MKVALAHELLTMKGGAERVLQIFADMFPNAPIYTLLYNEEKLGDWFPKERVRTSKCQPPNWLLHSPLATNHWPLNHHLHLRHFPSAVEHFDFSGYDLVLSASSAFMHGLRADPKTKHICYVHSPARYLWDRTHDVQAQASKGILGPIKKNYLQKTFHILRTWDAEVAHRPHTLLAASKEVQRRIELYWRRESEVVYPPIDPFWLKETEYPTPASRMSYLLVSSLVRYKRIEIAIQACNALKLPLKIAGRGPDMARLQALAGPTIEFLGFVEDHKLRTMYYNAKAVLFPGDEDFGLVPLEAMSQGTPVIAFKSGGALETIQEGQTGTFFTEPTPDSLWSVLEKFETSAYNSDICKRQAQQFTKHAFIQGIKQSIERTMAK